MFLSDYSYYEKTKGNFTSKRKIKYAGVHLIVEFWGCKKIESLKEIKKILVEATKKSRATLLSIQVHKFSPQGISGAVLLAESHISIHSWPELNYLAVDIFTCGKKVKPEIAIRVLRQHFQPKKVRIIKIKRGKA